MLEELQMLLNLNTTIPSIPPLHPTPSQVRSDPTQLDPLGQGNSIQTKHTDSYTEIMRITQLYQLPVQVSYLPPSLLLHEP